MAALKKPPARPARPAQPAAAAKPPPKPAGKPAGKPAAPSKAKAPNSAPAVAAARAQNTGSGFVPLLIAIFGLVAVGMIVALPTVPIVLLGMIPTAVALFVDRSYHKTAAICVAGLNFAGVAPFVAILWKGSNTLGHGMTILGDVYSWLAMYGAAALGWMLYVVLPPLAASILRIVSEQRTAILRTQQRKIGEDWGIGTRSDEAAARAPSPPPNPVPAKQ